MEPLIKSFVSRVAGKMRMVARRATKVVARLRPVSPRPACGSSRTSSAPCYRTQPSAPLPAPRSRESESGAHYDTEEGPRSVAPAKLCSGAGRGLAGLRLHGPALASAVVPPRFGEHDADAAVCRNPKGQLPRHGQRSLGCGSGSMSAPFYGVSCSSLRPFPHHAARDRVRGAFPGGLLCRSACQG